MSRRERLGAALEAAGYDALVTTQRANQLYFVPHAEPVSGLPPIPFLVLRPDETIAIPGAPFYYACRDQLTACEVVETLVGGVSALEALALLLGERGWRRVAFDQLAAPVAALLAKEAPSVVCVEEPRLGPTLRRSKEPGELALLRRAASIADLGIAAAFGAARPGLTNRDVAAAASAVMLSAGCEEVSLQVVSGPGTAYMGTGNWVLDPWRTLQAGDMLLVDMGILYHGYLGDQTRTAIIGEGTAQQREIIATVQEAYRQTREAMRPGAPTRDLYQITVNFLAEKGWRAYFPHHISHGLGLGGDLPSVNASSDDTLQVGDALSCEPGVYLPGIGGARFENMLYIGATGAEELTQSPVDPLPGGDGA
ncbi:MAG TPA: Xaa-Pro peptidase family protein [Caldilineaceae bacterium]|nr:Xaa-Pro peptidase family protein [Caldilineaceae bacterium]